MGEGLVVVRGVWPGVVRDGVRELIESGWLAREAGACFSVPQSTVSDGCRLWGMRMRHGAREGGMVGTTRPAGRGRGGSGDGFEVMVRGTGHGRRLGAQGRGAIAAGLARGDSLASIARFLGVAVSTVSREVAAGGGRQAYDPQARHAQARAARARPKARVLDSNDQLRALVVQGLRQRWSPQQISRRLAADHPEREGLSSFLCKRVVQRWGLIRSG